MGNEEVVCQPPRREPVLVDSGVVGDNPRHLRARERILAAATRTLTSNAGASLADIAREGGIGRTTLHRYFPTRSALQSAMTERALDRLEAVFANVDFDQPLADALAQLVTECLPLGPEMVLVGNTPELWEGDWGGRYQRFSTILTQAVERAQERGEARAGVPAWWAAELVMLNLWGGWYVVSGEYVGPRAMPRLILDTLLHGIAP